MDFTNLQGKKVVVMGLGLLGGGVEVVKWLHKKGAKVLVTDLKRERELRTSLKEIKKLRNIKFVLGRHREQDFSSADLIIKNPGVSRDSKFLKIARKNNIPIESDLSLFFRLFKGEIIGVTGTKGKSTTVSLLSHILKTAKKKFIFGGNIGQSPLNYLDKNYPLALLEISSWQLEDMAHLKKSPSVACVTTIFPDHLNTYKNFAEYVQAKKLIYKFQTKKDILILNADDPIVKKFAQEATAKIFYFSSQKSINKGIFTKNGAIIFRDSKEHKIINLTEIKTKISINSLLAAITIASIFKISPAIIKKALKSFRGVANRLEFIREINGIKYYNDSTSTVPQSTILALNSLTDKRNIILISGGADKGLDFSKMAKKIKENCKSIILLPGTATPKLKPLILNLKSRPQTIFAKNMKEAVKEANKIAEQNDIVLLSPGCASFGVFKNAYDRAAQFVAAVKRI